MKHEKQNGQGKNSNNARGARRSGRVEGFGSALDLAPEGSLAKTWWRAISIRKKSLALELARMMAQLEPGKRIEIRLEDGNIRVRFIHILKQPEQGCLSAILLPEVSDTFAV